MPRDRGPFRNGERVLVPHTDKYYEAKILKTERRDDMWYYLIHYAVSPAFHAPIATQQPGLQNMQKSVHVMLEVQAGDAPFCSFLHPIPRTL